MLNPEHVAARLPRCEGVNPECEQQQIWAAGGAIYRLGVEAEGVPAVRRSLLPFSKLLLPALALFATIGFMWDLSPGGLIVGGISLVVAVRLLVMRLRVRPGQP